MSASEQVQLMINGVRNKKKDGTLFMMAERIAWCSNGKDQFDISVMYADIKCQKVSPEGKSKIQLQIIKIDNESHIFHFVSPTSAKEDRESAKIHLAKMLPIFRRKIDKELKEKNKLLQTDPELLQLYKDLVVTSILTPEEFWSSNSAKLSKIAKEDSLKEQRVGVSPGFLADVRPQADGCNDLRYNLSADTIQSILSTFPAVKNKYLEKVPGKMGDEEFWTLFFQSHYFHRDRVGHSGSSSDIFADCAKKDEQEIQAILSNGVKDVFNDLKYLNDEDSTSADGYGATADINSIAKEKPTNHKLIQQNIIKRFNYQSAMILKNTSSVKSSSNKDDDQNESSTKKIRLQDTTGLKDLEPTFKSVNNNFLLHRTERYSHGPTISQKNSQTVNQPEAFEALNLVTIQCSQYQSRISSVLSSSAAATALNNLTTNFQKPITGEEDTIQRILNPAQCDELKQLYMSCCELLRHFWNCFPATNPTLEEKLQRLYESLRDFHQSKVLKFKEQLQRYRVGVNVTDHLEEMLKKAYDKFISWQNKKFSRR